MSAVERLSLNAVLRKAAFHPQFNTEEGVCVLFRVREMETWRGGGALKLLRSFQYCITRERDDSMGVGMAESSQGVV